MHNQLLAFAATTSTDCLGRFRGVLDSSHIRIGSMWVMVVWWRRFRVCTSALILLSCCILGVQAQTPAPAEAPPSATDSQASALSSAHLRANSTMKLSIGDLVEVSVFGVPELATKARISSSGDIYLPLIDYVHVADLTLDEAQELIQNAWKMAASCGSPRHTFC